MKKTVRKGANRDLRADLEGLVKALRKAAEERDKAAREFARAGMPISRAGAEGEALAYAMAARWLKTLLEDE